MKKRVFLFLIVATMVFLCGCSEKAVDNDQILYDIENYEQFSSLDVDIFDWEIIKRQTSPEDKVDFVYVTVKAANKDYSVVRNYTLTYKLYNDGWLFEKIEKYINPDCPSSTAPLHGVSWDQVSSDLDGLGLESCHSGLGEIYGTRIFDPVIEEEYLPITEDGYCHIEVAATYEYCLFFEDVIFAINYNFSGADNDPGSYRWYPSINNFETERSIRLDDLIVGHWSNQVWYDLEGELTISSCTETTCQATLRITEWSEDYVISGEFVVDCWYNDNNGKISSVRLELANPDQFSEDYRDSISICLDSYEEGTIDIRYCGSANYWVKVS